MENNTLTITWRQSEKSSETAFLVPAHGQEIFPGTRNQPKIMVTHINYIEFSHDTDLMTQLQKDFIKELLVGMLINDGFGKRAPFKTITFEKGCVRLQRYGPTIDWWIIAEAINPMLSYVLKTEVITINLPEKPRNNRPLLSS